MVLGNEKIELIQGDDYIYDICLTNEDYSDVDKITFTCKALDINAQMIGDPDTKRFTYTISKTLTAQFIPLETTYDITIDFTDSTRESQTGIPLIIYRKQNPIGG